jgi:hypothetical protein
MTKSKIELLTDALSEGEKEYRDEVSVCAALLLKGCKSKKVVMGLSKVNGKKLNRIWNRLKRNHYFESDGKICLDCDGEDGDQAFMTTLLLMVLVARGFITRRLEK